MSKSIKNDRTSNGLKFGNDNPNAIEVIDLKKIFSDKKIAEEVKAVDGVSFSISKGEIFGLLGPKRMSYDKNISLLIDLCRKIQN